MIAWNLASSSATASLDLHELSGGPCSVRSHLRLERLADRLVIELDAEDPDPLSLVATAPDGKRDDFLYEEDVMQVVVGLPGRADPVGFLLVNPHNKRKAIGAGEHWPSTATRRADGWTLRVELPAKLVNGAHDAIALGVWRFYRGIHHQVHVLGESLPHPIDVGRMAVVVLRDKDDESLAQAQERVRLSIRLSQSAALESTLSAVRHRIANRAASPRRFPSPSLDTARQLARQRMERSPIGPAGYLCWNEQHFQNALIDLWELDGDQAWIDAAIERMTHTWAQRCDRTGVIDKFRDQPLPTWYDREGHWAMPLVTGVILYPIARLIHAVLTSPTLESRRARVEPWITLCRQTIAVHDIEWVELPSSPVRPGPRGNYLEWDHKGPRRVYPTGGSRMCPLNRANFLGFCLIDLGQALNDDEYLARAGMLARYFRAGCEVAEDGSLLWEYLLSRYPAEGEDTSHGAVQVMFAERCAAARIVFLETDLRRMASTLRQRVFKYEDVPCGTLRGYNPGLDIAVAAWASLCRFEPRVLPRIEAVLDTALAEGKFDFAKEGWGVRTVTMLELARRVNA